MLDKNGTYLKSDSIQVSIQYNSVDDGLAEILRVKALIIAKGGKDLTFRITEDYGMYELHIEYMRPETPSEQEQRLIGDSNRAEYRRQQYESLKKEFEK